MKQAWKLLCEQLIKTEHTTKFLQDEDPSMFWPSVHTVLPFQLLSSHDSAAM